MLWSQPPRMLTTGAGPPAGAGESVSVIGAEILIAWQSGGLRIGNRPSGRICAPSFHSYGTRGASLDHLVGEDVELWRNCQAERIGRLAIDHQLEQRRLLDRQIGGGGAPVKLLLRSSRPPAVNQTTLPLTP